MPELGAGTADILEAFGYKTAEIDRLVEQGVI